MGTLRLLLVGHIVGTSWGRDQIRRVSAQARRRGVHIVGADTPENLAGAPSEGLSLVDESIALDVHDPDECRRWARRQQGIDAVMTIRELAVYSASVIAEELGLPGNAPDAVYGIRNKDLCRERLREAGFDQPVTALCRDLAQAKSFMQNNPPGPWIVKPRDGLASIGVSRIANDQELQDAIAKFGPPPPAMGSLPASDSFLIETFVDGHEFSAEGFMHDGKAHVVSLTRKVNAQDFIEVGHRIPSGLEPQTATAASDAVAEALTIAGIARGVFHVEFWVTDCGIVLGELHDRPGGDYIHALVESTRPGFELYGALLDDLLDIPATPVPSERGACAARFLLCPPGRLRGINGWEDIKKHPSVLAADMFICPGDLVGPVADSFGRHAVFVVQGPSIDEVDALIEALSSQVTFDVG